MPAVAELCVLGKDSYNCKLTRIGQTGSRVGLHACRYACRYVSPNNFQTTARFSWKWVWMLCQWRSPHLPSL